mmetsp:Transcript_15993/g.40801  ORF Transcript_15993/g.40801 Transcript_15993/m.40801 type:complete len:154 (-) Transcript_15993:301-762(-)
MKKFLVVLLVAALVASPLVDAKGKKKWGPKGAGANVAIAGIFSGAYDTEHNEQTVVVATGTAQNHAEVEANGEADTKGKKPSVDADVDVEVAPGVGGEVDVKIGDEVCFDLPDSKKKGKECFAWEAEGAAAISMEVPKIPSIGKKKGKGHRWG